MIEENKAFAKNLASALKMRHMSQRDLARRTGITEAAVSRYVKGLRQPRAMTTQRIAAALDVPITSLLDTTGDMPESLLAKAVSTVCVQSVQLSAEQRASILRALADTENIARR